jgi:hypothetical protein
MEAESRYVLNTSRKPCLIECEFRFAAIVTADFALPPTYTWTKARYVLPSLALQHRYILNTFRNSWSFYRTVTLLPVCYVPKRSNSNFCHYMHKLKTHTNFSTYLDRSPIYFECFLEAMHGHRTQCWRRFLSRIPHCGRIEKFIPDLLTIKFHRWFFHK